MPIYQYKCLKCKEETEKLLSFTDCDKVFNCEKCGNNLVKLMPSGISGGTTAEPWEYEYTHKMNPKYVKDSKGNRMKFNPNTMRKGRKGSG